MADKPQANVSSAPQAQGNKLHAPQQNGSQNIQQSPGQQRKSNGQRMEQDNNMDSHHGGTSNGDRANKSANRQTNQSNKPGGMFRNKNQMIPMPNVPQQPLPNYAINSNKTSAPANSPGSNNYHPNQQLSTVNRNGLSSMRNGNIHQQSMAMASILATQANQQNWNYQGQQRQPITPNYSPSSSASSAQPSNRYPQNAYPSAPNSGPQANLTFSNAAQNPNQPALSSNAQQQRPNSVSQVGGNPQQPPQVGYAVNGIRQMAHTGAGPTRQHQNSTFNNFRPPNNVMGFAQQQMNHQQPGQGPGQHAAQQNQLSQGQGEVLSPTNLYVKGLHESTTDEYLFNMCCHYGPIRSTKAIVDKESQMCKGYGFVDFENAKDATNAVKELTAQGIQLQFAKITNKQDQEAEPDYTNLYFANLAPFVSESDLEAMLQGFGTVISTRILRDSQQTSKGVGFARMGSRDICEKIIEMYNGNVLAGHTEALVVKFADNASKRRQKTNTGMGNNNQSPISNSKGANNVNVSTSMMKNSSPMPRVGVSQNVNRGNQNYQPHPHQTWVPDANAIPNPQMNFNDGTQMAQQGMPIPKMGPYPPPPVAHPAAMGPAMASPYQHAMAGPGGNWYNNGPMNHSQQMQQPNMPNHQITPPHGPQMQAIIPGTSQMDNYANTAIPQLAHQMAALAMQPQPYVAPNAYYNNQPYAHGNTPMYPSHMHPSAMSSQQQGAATNQVSSNDQQVNQKDTANHQNANDNSNSSAVSQQQNNITGNAAISSGQPVQHPYANASNYASMNSANIQ